MQLLERYAALLKLVRATNEAGSWSGETHIQKSVFFLQEALATELGYGFILYKLYKHGPFSFELRDDRFSPSESMNSSHTSRLPEPVRH